MKVSKVELVEIKDRAGTSFAIEAIVRDGVVDRITIKQEWTADSLYLGSVESLIELRDALSRVIEEAQKHIEDSHAGRLTK